MVLEIKDTLYWENRKCYHISSRLNSNPDLRFLFSLNDTIDVYTTYDSLLPLLYEERLNEGRYHAHLKMRYDHDSLFVSYNNDSLRFNIFEQTRDLLSFWYYLRQIPLLEGDTIKVKIHKSKENFRVDCYVAKGQTIKTKAGEFRTIMVQPQTKGKGIFGGQGSMIIWYSDDQRRLPVKIKTRIKYGSIIFNLTQVRD